MPRVVKHKIVEDERGLGAQFEEWADLPSLTRILMSHGDPIEFEPRNALRELARSLH